MVDKLKHKNNDIVPQIFIAVVAVMLTGIVIYYVMNSVKSTSKLADTVLASTEETVIDYTEHDIVMYDGEDIRGSEVVNFIKKHLGDYDVSDQAPIYVNVITKASASVYTHTYTNNKYIDDIKNFSSIEYYIKPTAIFVGEVIRTDNKVIIGVEFTQK